MHLHIVIFFLCAAVCACVKLPSSVKQCYRKDKKFQECLRDAIQRVVRNVKTPIKEIGLSSVDPLIISSLEISAGTGPVSITQKYKNMRIAGFSQGNITKVSWDFGTNTVTVKGLAPLARADFDYEADGKILVVSLKGRGPGFVEMYNVDTTFTCHLEEYENKGEKHYKVINNTLTLAPESIKLRLENLFDGDKSLGENINQVLNENSVELFADVKPGYEGAFGTIFTDIFNRVLTKFSIKELFGDP